MNSAATVLVTGASSDVGLELARQFAQHGYSLLLTAPGQDELDDIAAELTRDYDILAGVIAKDLEKPNAPQEIFDAVMCAPVEIEVLVNNIGVSASCAQCEAALRLTKLFLPQMIRRERSWILNTASIFGIEPRPTPAAYLTTNAFLLSFSKALRREVANTNVSITTLRSVPTAADFLPHLNH